jgi:hypothetical protein
MREIQLTAAGHPDVTGRHDKTLEFTAEDAITARATCILGVSAGPLPGELPSLRGRVRLTLTAGDETAEVEGEVNPGYASAERLVVRRSDQRDPGTFLVNATAAAADLPPRLLAALAEPAARIDIIAAETGTPTPVVLVLTGGPVPDEIARLAAQADLVVDLTGRGAPPPAVPVTAPRVHAVPADGSRPRTTVVLTEDPATAVPLTTGARVVLWPPVPGAALLLSAGRPPVPLLQAGAYPATAAGRRQLVRLLGTPAPVVLDLPGPADLAELAPEYAVIGPHPEVGWGVRARAGPPEAAGTVVLVPPPRDQLAVDPAELARLLRQTQTGRDAAAVLTALGVPRREAYRLAADSGREPR